MRIAIYARVSKDENVKDNRYQDPENQLIILRKWAAANEHQIVAEYIDRQSGADANRPQFQSMLKDAFRKNFKAIVVWKLDRFSREPMFVILGYIEQLKIQGTGLISVTEGWLDTREENPVSELILAIMAWFSGEERRKISERTKAGIARKKSEGTYKGGRPKGSVDKKPRKKAGYYLKKGGYRKQRVSL